MVQYKLPREIESPLGQDKQVTSPIGQDKLPREVTTLVSTKTMEVKNPIGQKLSRKITS